jgi:hypothetical protein
VNGRCPRPLDDRVLKDSYGCTKSEVRKRKIGIAQTEKKNLPQRHQAAADTPIHRHADIVVSAALGLSVFAGGFPGLFGGFPIQD